MTDEIKNQSADLETLLVSAAVRALRRRADVQRSRASSEIAAPEDYPAVRIVSGRGAIAQRIAEALDEVATDLEAGIVHSRN